MQYVKITWKISDYSKLHLIKSNTKKLDSSSGWNYFKKYFLNVGTLIEIYENVL